MSRRPSPAMLVALLALFVALGGSSYAALKVGSAQIVNNSIRSKDIRNSQVTSRDLRNGGVRTEDVLNGSLMAADFKSGQLRAGPQGPAGATHVVIRSRAGSGTGVTATCQGHERVVGGGVDGDVGPFTSHPAGPEGGAPTGWHGKSEAGTPEGDDVRAFAVCASP